MGLQKIPDSILPVAECLRLNQGMDLVSNYPKDKLSDPESLHGSAKYSQDNLDHNLPEFAYLTDE